LDLSLKLSSLLITSFHFDFASLDLSLLFEKYLLSLCLELFLLFATELIPHCSLLLALYLKFPLLCHLLLILAVLFLGTSLLFLGLLLSFLALTLFLTTLALLLFLLSSEDLLPPSFFLFTLLDHLFFVLLPYTF
jgi:hypothetical protein